MEANKPTDIVWLQTSFLGDIVLTSAACRLAMDVFPQARHHLITTDIGAKCFDDFGFDQVLVFEKKSGVIKSFRKLKKALMKVVSNHNQTVLLQPHRSYRSSLLSAYLGFETTTYRQTKFSFLAKRKVERVAIFHESARIGLLLEPHGVSRDQIISARPSLVVNESSKLGDTLLRRDGPVIGIAPGSVWATKRWPIEKYTELVATLLNRYSQSTVVLLGTETERTLADQISLAIDDGRIVNLAGKTSLDDLRGIYPKLSILISNDSSPIHYASAFNIPTLAIFGATVPEMGFGPLADRSEVAEIKLDCRPCSDHGPTVCPLGHFKCMNDLSVEQVFLLGSKTLG